MANRWEQNGNSDRLFSWAPKSLQMVTAAMIKKYLSLGRKAMTNLDILKIRDITLLTLVCLVKAIVFPVVTYGYESWTIKKAEHQRFETFELWCWRRFLRAPWTARRSILNELNQSILSQESSPALNSPVTLSLVSHFPTACLYLSLCLCFSLLLSFCLCLSVSLCVCVCVCVCI